MILTTSRRGQRPGGWCRVNGAAAAGERHGEREDGRRSGGMDLAQLDHLQGLCG